MPTPFERILEFNKGRVPHILQLKYDLMAMDAFRFFRGTCHLFYEDLAKKITWKDDTKAWICGDLHLENFGSYKGDNRVVYFDVNDYDESILAPVTWEVVRMLTSIHVAADVLKLSKEQSVVLAENYIDTFIASIQGGKALAVEKETVKGLLKEFLEKVADRSDKELVKKRASLEKKRLKVDGIKFLPLSNRKDIMKAAKDWLEAHYGKGTIKIHDAAYRIAGTGSLGLRRYVVLKEIVATGEIRLIDIKESAPSSVLPYVPTPQPEWPNQAERIKTLQKRGQYVQPAWMHTLEIEGVSFVAKELQPTEDKMDLSLCKGKTKKLSDIICNMAHLNASENLRSTGRQGSSIADELIAFANDQKKWKQKVLAYAQKYAEQVLVDYNSFKGDYEQFLKSIK
jgi:uncharacterized protein (DUF2252 family)